MVAVGVAVVAFSLIWNVTLLVGGRQLYAERADLTRALVVLGTTDPLPPGVAPNLSLLLVPSPVELRRVIATYGSPMTDPLAPGSVPPVRRARWPMRRAARRIRPTGSWHSNQSETVNPGIRWRRT